ncbi:MAG: hypothetical protein KDA17_00240 [Candidatus Saccharibacteria bacterium]|nr:hypothetical protein [Candidatus Saccharibacteria bacterium]
MAISELCPETGEVCQARLWLQEIEGSITVERYSSDDLFSGETVGQKVMRAWDILGGHHRDRNKALEEDMQWISNAAEAHEESARLGAKKCNGTFCATLAHVVLTARGI